MRAALAVFLLASSSAIYAQTASVEKTILQLEHDWTEAGLKKDAKTMDRIMADDWIATDFLGKTVNEAQHCVACCICFELVDISR